MNYLKATINRIYNNIKDENIVENMIRDIKKIDREIVIPDWFEKIKIDEIEMEFQYTDNSIIIILQSNHSSEKLKKMWDDLYDYFSIIFGFNVMIIGIEMNNKECCINEAEKYKTDKKFIRKENWYFNELNKNYFFESFKKFIKFKEKANLNISMFNVSMIESNIYPQIAIVNVLQCIDGILDILVEFNEKIKIINDKLMKEVIKQLRKNQKIKDEIKSDINNIISDEDKYKKIKDNICSAVRYSNNLNFNEKLKLLCIDNDDFKIFEFEKGIKNTKYDIDNLISFFVKTRNTLSHSSTRNEEYLNSKESSIYIFKLIMLYRILILEEIGLKGLIDKKIIEKNIEIINSYIKTELLGERISIQDIKDVIYT